VAERYAAIREFIEASPESLHPVTRAIIEPARALHAVDAFEAQYRLAALKRMADGLIADVDCVLIPTAPTIYRIDEVEADPITLNSRLGHYTNFMNLLDYAALAVPAGFRGDGLPFGVTLFAPAWRDRFLLTLGARLQKSYGLPLGATAHMPPTGDTEIGDDAVPDRINIVACGAHMEGLPLNHQLTERGATLVRRMHTAPGYRLYALGGSSAGRPGMVRDASTDAAIEVEVWTMPIARLGSFMKLIPAPLGLGTIELADGSRECGFICEQYGLEGASEVTHLGGWRRYLAERQGG
jgi:allophanate hydrolase